MTILAALFVLSSWAITTTTAFSNTIFQESIIAQRTAPSKVEGVEIELPNFDELFERVKQVSPLARVAMEKRDSNDDNDDKRGFLAAAKYDGTYILCIVRVVVSLFVCLCRVVSW